MADQDIASALDQARQEIQALRRRLDLLEAGARPQDLPATMLLDHSFLRRAFAVLGHYMAASLLIMIPFYIVFFLLMLAGGLD